MRIFSISTLCLFFWSITYNSYSQHNDSTKTDLSIASSKKIKGKDFIIPAVLIGYGAIVVNNHSLQKINQGIHNSITPNDLSRHVTVDNYLQFAPGAIAFGLKFTGLKGRHNVRDAAIIYATSNILVNAFVIPIKHLSNELRPNATDNVSFPSGHTAEAFLNAEFLRMEYKDESPWYGIAGYAIAGTTGYLRMYNNEHWFNDVLAGAGFGIASTKIAYWIFSKASPLMNKKKNRSFNTMILPTFQNNTAGFCMVTHF
jgi:membrane-associated phospholipid phosphatase